MKKASNPVTPAARDAFLVYLHEWQERLGLQDWRINISPIPSKRSAAEVVRRNLEARLATVRLGVDFGADIVDDSTLEDTALHELLHVFLHELVELSRDHTISEELRMSAEHRVIHTLVNLLVHGR